MQQRFLQSNSLSLVLTHKFYTVSRAVEADSNTDSLRPDPTRPDPARQLWFEPETKSRKGKNTNIGGRPSKMNYNLAEQWLLSRTSPGCFPDFIAAAREQSTVVDAKTLFAKISNVGRRGPLRCNPWTNLHTRPVSPPRNDPSIKAFEDRPIDLRIRKGG